MQVSEGFQFTVGVAWSVWQEYEVFGSLLTWCSLSKPEAGVHITFRGLLPLVRPHLLQLHSLQSRPTSHGAEHGKLCPGERLHIHASTLDTREDDIRSQERKSHVRVTTVQAFTAIQSQV